MFIRVAGKLPVDRSFRNIMKHSAVYGVGLLLAKLTSFLLLPLYTRHLTPTDYGCIAVIDLMAGILTLTAGSGLTEALSRYHFEAKDELGRRQVWWTGIIFRSCSSLALFVPLWFCSGWIAMFLFGPDQPQGARYVEYALPTIGLAFLVNVPLRYLRVRKYSGWIVGLSLLHLVINVLLNVFFVVVCHYGAAGVLLGNLLTTMIMACIMMSIFVGMSGLPTVKWGLIKPLSQFSAPLVVAAALSIAMRQSDRYLLRLFLDLGDVGIYTIAFTIGSAVNALYMVPFNSIWGVTIYEIAERPDAKSMFVRVFKYYMYGVMLIMFGVALFGPKLLPLIVPKEFHRVGDVLPLICLAYVFYSLHLHFKVPALLSKKTTSLIAASGIATAVSAGLNVLLIPWMGINGAALACVATFACFSFGGLWRYRQIDTYPYPFARCGVILGALIVTYFACRMLSFGLGPVAAVFSAAGFWLVWAIALFGPIASDLFPQVRRFHLKGG